MSKVTVGFIVSVLIVGIVITGFYVFNDSNKEEVDEKLTIYTYESLLADPGFAFDRAFEKEMGLANGTIEVVYLEDAGSIITKAFTEKDDPIADVLIGIDNVLVEKARTFDLLEAYQPNGYQNLLPGLVEGLASDYLLTPYDYGVISMWYLKNRFVGDLNNQTFVLDDLLTPSIASQVIVEDPRLSSPGLGFLLNTIAIYGDAQSGVSGVIDGDWENFWSTLATNARITPSWGSAIDLLYTEEEGRPMMVSYTSSPAYGSCLFDDYSTASILSNENAGSNLGWQQIEGIGLVKNSDNSELAKKFIDWFISDTVQSQIYENQWIYPAISGISTPDCYSSAIPLENISPLNSRISPSTISANIDGWLDRWEIAVTI